jgi:hypothetical protein
LAPWVPSYTFALTPGAGCSLDLKSVDLDVKASGKRPTTGDLATSADSFTEHSASFAGTSKGTATVSATGSGALEIRVYGHGASGTGGTLRIQNTMIVSGSLL